MAEPDWIAALRAEAAKTSQNKAAKRIGYSAAAVSQILAGKYPGDQSRIELAVRGALLDGKVDCPSLGSIRADDCVGHMRQAGRLNTTNPLRVRMFRACQACARFKGEEQ